MTLEKTSCHHLPPERDEALSHMFQLFPHVLSLLRFCKNVAIVYVMKNCFHKGHEPKPKASYFAKLDKKDLWNQTFAAFKFREIKSEPVGYTTGVYELRQS